MRTAVLALGGNALARAGEPATVANQFRHARESMAAFGWQSRMRWARRCLYRYAKYWMILS